MIEDFVLTLPDHEAKLVKRLHQLVTEISPRLTCRFSYGVPYYFGKRRVCFIWPSSKGASGVKEGVLLGFCEGHLLEDESGSLQMGTRKQVGIIPYTQLNEIKREVIQPLLLQAELVDKG